jgi:hypothetical protein
MSKEISAFSVDTTRRYWVVRADSGTYYQHFNHNGLVAVGFFDEIEPKNSNSEELHKERDKLLERLVEKLAASEEKPSRPRIDSKVEQCLRFIDEMYVGDWVVTLDDARIRIGRITSEAFLDSASIYPLPSPDERDPLPMAFALRRKVSWGPELTRSVLPLVMRNALSAHMTVFSLDRYWQELHHLLFPVFQVEDDLYFSLRINAKDGINNYLVSQLLEYCSEIEACVRLEAAGNEPTANFEEQVFDLAQNNRLRLETKASYFSPGLIWGILQDVGTSPALWVTAAYIAVFGNKKLGFDGIVDIESKHKILDFILKRWDKKQGKKIQEHLVIDLPTADTKKLTDTTNDVTNLTTKKPTRAKTTRSEKRKVQ